MEALRMGPLRVRRVVKGSVKAGETALTVVLMHGYGAPGDDLVMLAEALDAPPGTTFLFPEAPTSLADLLPIPIMGDARAWWQIDVGRFERAIAAGTLDQIVDEIPDGLAKARDDVSAMLDALERDGVRGDQVVLGGFSQGSMLALDVALRSSRALAGVAIMSGALIAAKEWVPRMPARKGMPVFQSHGDDDPLLPFSVAQRLRREMDDAGMSVSFTQFAGGHGIPPSVMRDLGAWLARLPALAS